MWSACVIEVLMEEWEAILRLMDADQLQIEEPVCISQCQTSGLVQNK